MSIHKLLGFLTFLTWTQAGPVHAFADASPSPDSGTRLVVFADVHGAFDELTTLLQAAGVIDASLHWTGGATHLVSVGDLLDRGPDSRQVMDLLMRLEQEAAARGGQVQMVLGNHEVMNLIGDLRYVSAEEFAAFAPDEDARARKDTYRDFLKARDLKNSNAARTEFEKLYPPGFFGLREAMKPDGQYGKWLLEKPFIHREAGFAFVHGGLPPRIAEIEVAQYNQSLTDNLREYLELWHGLIEDGLFKPWFSTRDRAQVVNALLAGQLPGKRWQDRKLQARAQRFLTLAGEPPISSESPTWYRGNSMCHEFWQEPIVDAALARLGATRVVVGHTPTPGRQVMSRLGGKVLLLDTGMLKSHYHGHPSALVIENGDLRVLDPENPDISRPLASPIRLIDPPNNLPADTLEAALKNARLVDSEIIAGSFTKPEKVTLADGERKIRGIFKSYDSDPGLHRGQWPRLGDKADRYQHDIAAWRLDQMLGLNMVPVTVERELGGKVGALQYWLENSASKSDLITQNREFDSWCDQAGEMALMEIFDALIYNDDRNTGNRLYTEDNGNLWLIDHSRAFRNKRSLPQDHANTRFVIGPTLRKNLAALNEDNLSATMNGLLHKYQIRALLSRRDKILEQAR